MKSWAWRGYLLALHLAVAVLLVKGDVLGRLAVHAGLRDAPDHPFIANMRGQQARLDPAIPAGAVLFLGDSNMQSLPVSEVVPHAVNLGVGWERSDQLLQAMDSYGAMQRASTIVVMIGTNDVGQGREPRYREVLAKVPASVPVVLASPPPMVGADMRAQAALARAACAADSRCTFVDAFAALDGRPGMLLPDGVHLTPQGYAVLIPLLREAVRRSHTSPS